MTLGNMGEMEFNGPQLCAISSGRPSLFDKSRAAEGGVLIGTFLTIEISRRAVQNPSSNVTLLPREPIRMECFLTCDLTRRLRFIALNKAPNRWAVTGFRRLEGMPGLILHFPAEVSTESALVRSDELLPDEVCKKRRRRTITLPSLVGKGASAGDIRFRDCIE
jgi:hypothetical protein